MNSSSKSLLIEATLEFLSQSVCGGIRAVFKAGYRAWGKYYHGPSNPRPLHAVKAFSSDTTAEVLGLKGHGNILRTVGGIYEGDERQDCGHVLMVECTTQSLSY